MSAAAVTRPPFLLPSQFELDTFPTTTSPPPPPLLTIKTPTLEQTKQLHGRFLRAQFHHHLLPHFFSPSAHLNSLISSYTKNNSPLAAIKLYVHARKTFTAALDFFTIPTVLKSCALCSSLCYGAEVHGFAIKLGFDCDAFVHNSLIQMYSECQDLSSAIMVFDEMPVRDVVSWSTMIRTYGRSGLFQKAMRLITEMFLVGVNPSEIAMINMINALADAEALGLGQQVHAFFIKSTEFNPPDVNIHNAVIDMYAKCGRLDLARKVFDRTDHKSIASWTAMINGYVRFGEFGIAMDLLGRMAKHNVEPNQITMLSLVSNCGIHKKLRLGKWLHAYMIRQSLEIPLVLLDMYCKCGDTKSARTLFDSMSVKDVSSWSVMISGYAQANCFNEPFKLFRKMKNVGVKPNEISILSLLSLCADFGALDRGREVHAFIDQQGIEMNIVLLTALVDMYAKCGEMEEAYKIFKGAEDKDICMWNSMLNGLAMNGHGNEAIKFFFHMESAKIRPNDISFVGILKACSHAGLVLEGKRFFRRMVDEYGLVPRVEHYGCMVDLLGRAGLLDEAHEMIRRMPISPNVVVWGALIAACRVHKNSSLGELAASEIHKLDPSNVGCNILLSNIYAAEGRWSDVAGVRRAIKDGGLKKAIAVSSIELNDSIHEFVNGDASHARTEEIYNMVAEMKKELKQAGHVPNTSVVLLKIDEEEKESTLCLHSENLAIAFGLISTRAHTPLRIVKNLRVCDDCHESTKLLSKIYGRVITVRDRNRYHHFAEGFCSCGDYW
ncbi:pentatricopeptide repeat-containing protein At1g08070, chloroplastic-like [Phalaenopsis equestris]|uniref:pentatricopeptide repeat-containing protein At1g08070, chloroplastic-like n=1 Tax=Phalaenopsis equestris TaxID=78828 RepID=UPI0009E2795F|nr:pentatricopeptide repeat-containing protein At1g08070, chloroplastic-like [Phalaenopsis equestris]